MVDHLFQMMIKKKDQKFIMDFRQRNQLCYQKSWNIMSLRNQESTDMLKILKDQDHAQVLEILDQESESMKTLSLAEEVTTPDLLSLRQSVNLFSSIVETNLLADLIKVWIVFRISSTISRLSISNKSWAIQK